MYRISALPRLSYRRRQKECSEYIYIWLKTKALGERNFAQKREGGLKMFKKAMAEAKAEDVQRGIREVCTFFSQVHT
jgi:hypothetical protein